MNPIQPSTADTSFLRLIIPQGHAEERPPSGMRLRDLCAGILSIVERVSTYAPQTLHADIANEMERELTPHLEHGLRVVADSVRQQLHSWLKTAQELERLAGAGGSPRALANPVCLPFDESDVSDPDGDFALEFMPDGEPPHSQDTIAGVPLPVHPRLVSVYLDRARTCRARKEFPQAIENLNAVLATDPNHLEAYLQRGNALLEWGRVDEAIADYSAALDLAPQHATLYMNRALGRARKNAWYEAAADADAALRLDARLGGAYFVRAVARAHLGDSPAALADLDRLLQLEPDNPLAHNERGLVHASGGEHQRALLDYAHALRLRPTFALARFNLAIALRQNGEVTLAARELTRLIAAHPGNAVLHYQRGLAYLGSEAFEEALADFDATLEIAADFAPAERARRSTLSRLK
jgi:tetratricopeptide (TPR) repeat protein